MDNTNSDNNSPRPELALSREAGRGRKLGQRHRSLRLFSSLDRCSCVNLATTDLDDDENTDEAKDRPLTYS